MKKRHQRLNTITYSTVSLEFLLENILNMIGFLVGLVIGTMSMIGFHNTGSPTLFRFTIAFFAISIGFLITWSGYLAKDMLTDSDDIAKITQTIGIAVQTVGYFFIAFSHSIKAFLPKSSYFRSIGITPLFLISTVQIEHIFRSVSFILLVYSAIETILSYFESRKRGAISVSTGLALLALGEFLGWYSFVFPESILYTASISIKITGLLALFIPVSNVPLTRIKIDEEDMQGNEEDQKIKSHTSKDTGDKAPKSNQETDHKESEQMQNGKKDTTTDDVTK